jgi:serine carboxypeptidase-like clade 2
VANILYPESPVGVGFSYAADTEVYKAMGDNMTASDSLDFLLKWLDRFPEYKNRDLFVVGESYAGHYVPELAVAIQAAKTARPAEVPINLKGIAVSARDRRLPACLSVDSMHG